MSRRKTHAAALLLPLLLLLLLAAAPNSLLLTKDGRVLVTPGLSGDGEEEGGTPEAGGAGIRRAGGR